MKGHIPIPEGLQVPEDGYKKPFSLSGVFIVRGDKLMPLEIGGYPVPCGEEGEEYGEEEEGGCCGAYKKGPEHMCPDCPKAGGGFLIAIEKAMKPMKR